ncbi:MAG: reverse transcriptase domain-containing protein [Oscillospiraceae bacterium]|nr:reverse transcriptase domain-containing protein [Oscillospiraceae bacterium]
MSPLLSNVVLNELDWWIDSQWKAFNIKERKVTVKKDGTTHRGGIYEKLRKTNLKEMYIIRYADDFKIFCRHKTDSEKTFEAVKMWLKERLDLEINMEKSAISDLRRSTSEFLGFRFKAKLKGEKWVINSHMSGKSKSRSAAKIRECIEKIKESPTPQNILRYNATVVGIQNYFNIATHVNIDCGEIENNVRIFRHNHLNTIMSESGIPSQTYTKRYKGYNYKKQYVAGICLFPIPAVKHKNPLGFTQKICDYTEEGRNLIHNKLKINTDILHYIMENPLPNDSAELADNRISVYSAQWGKCFITGEELKIGEMEIHHIIPKELNGDDNFKNLVWVTENVHKLIHATKEDTINKYLQLIKLDKNQLEKLNKLRVKSVNCVIEQKCDD